MLFLLSEFVCGQVRIRLFSGSEAGLAILTVISGKYEMDTYSDHSFEIAPGEIVIISRVNNRLNIKTRRSAGITCDSLLVTGISGDDSFSLRVNGILRYYSGDLNCYCDLGALMLINICDMESYIAGVVKAEGGSGRNIEYFKTQAVIARTYMYRYFDKHITDHFNLCDDTHCQVFQGITDDSTIIRAALDTKGEVILGSDSALIIAAFHSNCGGETAPSESVWLTGEPYLRRVTDPFCTASRNAKWQKSISLNEWIAYLGKAGYTGDNSNPELFNLSQATRLTEYKTGGFSVSLRQIRTDLNLRSTFFSVRAAGDSVLLSGRGYGHGVGLCQEGAMSMALKGFDYRQIINFYYTGVHLADITEAVAREK